MNCELLEQSCWGGGGGAQANGTKIRKHNNFRTAAGDHHAVPEQGALEHDNSSLTRQASRELRWVSLDRLPGLPDYYSNQLGLDKSVSVSPAIAGSGHIKATDSLGPMIPI